MDGGMIERRTTVVFSYRWLRRSRYILTFTVIPVALVARLATAVIRAGRVDAVRMLVATVQVRGLALVHLDAVELVQLPVAGQTLAHVRTERVDAARVQMAVITIRTTLLSAFVDVCRRGRGWEKEIYVSDPSLDLSFGATAQTRSPARCYKGPWATFFADTKLLISSSCPCSVWEQSTRRRDVACFSGSVAPNLIGADVSG